MRNNDAVLAEQTADLVHKSHPIGDQTTANPMNSLDRQLFGGFDRNKPHVRTPGCLANRLGVIPIILVGLYIWRDELRADQSNVMPELGESLGPIVRAVRSFHPNDAGWKVCEEGRNVRTA